MSESKTPRTDAATYSGWIKVDDGSYAPWHTDKQEWTKAEVARTLESELTRLSAEKAEVERERDEANRETESIRTLMNCYNLGGWTDSLQLLKRAETAESALLQAREDALEEAAKVCDGQMALGVPPGHNAAVIGCASTVRALKSARQAEPQEGEK